jgi:hypothetical protein
MPLPCSVYKEQPGFVEFTIPISAYFSYIYGHDTHFKWSSGNAWQHVYERRYGAWHKKSESEIRFFYAHAFFLLINRDGQYVTISVFRCSNDARPSTM